MLSTVLSGIDSILSTWFWFWSLKNIESINLTMCPDLISHKLEVKKNLATWRVHQSNHLYSRKELLYRQMHVILLYLL